MTRSCYGAPGRYCIPVSARVIAIDGVLPAASFAAEPCHLKSPAVQRNRSLPRFSLRLAHETVKILPVIGSFGGYHEVPTDRDLDRRTFLKFGARISVLAVASSCPVSAAVLANNNEIVAPSARAVVVTSDEGNSVPSAMLERCSTDTRLTRICTRSPTSTRRAYWKALGRSTEPALEARNSGHLPACR
jgi:hypothetical protein